MKEASIVSKLAVGLLCDRELKKSERSGLTAVLRPTVHNHVEVNYKAGSFLSFHGTLPMSFFFYKTSEALLVRSRTV